MTREIKCEIHEKERIESRKQLSALIEVGRFFFPNIDKGNGFGQEKPAAYQGYRHIALDFLVLIYEMTNKDNIWKCQSEIEYMKRHFTSIVFQIVSPRKRIKNVKQYANIVMPEEMSIVDFMAREFGKIDITTIYNYYK